MPGPCCAGFLWWSKGYSVPVRGLLTAAASVAEKLLVSGASAFAAWGSVPVAHRLSCLLACGALSDQGLNARLLRCQVDALPLSCQERACLLEVLGMAATELSWHLSLLLSSFPFFFPQCFLSLSSVPSQALKPTFPSFYLVFKFLTLSRGAAIRCSGPVKSDASVDVCKEAV